MFYEIWVWMREVRKEKSEGLEKLSKTTSYAAALLYLTLTSLTHTTASLVGVVLYHFMIKRRERASFETFDQLISIPSTFPLPFPLLFFIHSRMPASPQTN